MSHTQTDTTGETAEGHGRHRGPAAAGEEAAAPARGRHRRPAQDDQED